MHSNVKKRRLAALDKLGRPEGAVPPATAGQKKPKRPPSTADASHVGRSANRSKTPSKAAPARKDGPSCQVPEGNADMAAARMQTQASVYQPLSAKKASAPSPVLSLVEQLMSTSTRNVRALDAVRGKVQDQMILLDNPTAGLSNSSKHRKKTHWHTASAQRALSSSQCRRLGISLPAAGAPFSTDATLSLAARRRQCSEQLACTGRSMEDNLLALSFCGCHVEVVSARNPQFVGRQGTVVLETSNAFHVATSHGAISVIPKQGGRFNAIVPDGEGNHVAYLLEGSESINRNINGASR
mmetsp:Transcript_22132/g.56731  ORF Transcript_22132/g.56731 Transcript_22132/m.56731 type:complete len:298 (+) Transcript_22132:255-1148(+)|eukprot:jgi/Tetstr1/427303/TSEL_017472.t1